MPIDRLGNLIWADHPPVRVRAAVRTQVAHIRALLAEAARPCGPFDPFRQYHHCPTDSPSPSDS